MPPPEKVTSYQRRTASGQVVQVQAYERSNSEIAVEVNSLPGRPPMAAKPGSFANGRAVPVFAEIPPAPKVSKVSGAPAEDAQVFGDQLANRILGKTDHLSDGEYGQEFIDRVLAKRDSAKTTKVVAAAARYVLDADTVAL